MEILPHIIVFISLCIIIFVLWARSVPETISYPKQQYPQQYPQQYQQPVPAYTDTDIHNSNNNIYSSNTSGHRETNREKKKYNGPKITPTKVRDLGDEVFEL